MGASNSTLSPNYSAHKQLCLGIDPSILSNSSASLDLAPNLMQSLNPNSSLRFLHLLESHKQALQLLMQRNSMSKKVKWLKPNLAFFLACGSTGIAALESLMDEKLWLSKNNLTDCNISSTEQSFCFLLDAKFSEISNSLQHSLFFCFQHLRAHSVTLNPFFGEKSLHTAFEVLAAAPKLSTHLPPRKIFVLCETSESGSNTLQTMNSESFQLSKNLGFFQEKSETIVAATLQAAFDVFGHTQNVGFVVGANKLSNFENNENVQKAIESFKNASTEIELLCPGVGAQGVAESFLSEDRKYSCVFPLSRSIFQEGHNPPALVFENVQKYLDLIAKSSTKLPT